MSTTLTDQSIRTTIIRPTQGFASLNLREVWQYRDLLLTLAMRDVKLRYRQTALGVVWVVLQPLIAAAIFSVVFGRIGRFSTAGVNPFLFAYTGMLGWNVFSSTLTKASMCLVGNSQLVSKIYFPRLVLPLSTMFSTLLDFAVALALMAIFMPAFHVVPHAGILLLPVWLLLFMLFAMGLGLVAAALTVSYRDIQYVLPVFVQFFLFACPVAYTTPHIHNKWVSLFYKVNPMTSLLDGFRWSVLGIGHVDSGSLVYGALVIGLLFAWGLVVFRNMERRFADVI